MVTNVANKKKNFTKLHTKEVVKETKDFTLVNSESNCFYGTNKQVIDIMESNTKHFCKNVDFNNDEQLLDLKTFITYAAEFEGHLLMGMEKDKALEYVEKLRSIMTKYELSSLIDHFENLIESSEEQIVKKFDEMFEYVKFAVEKVALNFSRPKYFEVEMFRYLKYRRQQIKWGIIYENSLDSCYPTSPNTFMASFNEISKKCTCENIVVKNPGLEFIINDEEILSNGSIAISFWAKLSIEEIDNGNTLLLQINSFSNSIRVTQEKNSDGKSVNMVINVAGHKRVLNNSSPCSDITFNMIVIHKEAEHYRLYFINKSYNLNSRTALEIKISPELIENSLVKFNPIKFSHYDGILYLTNFCYDINDISSYLNKELEIVTHMTNDSIKNIINTISTNCDNPLSHCEYMADSELCYVCGDGYFYKEGLCVKDCESLFYEDYNSMECFPCPSECKECSSEKMCTKCDNGYNLFENQCIYECPPHTWSVEGKCESCSSTDNCLLCSDKESCKKCLNKFLLGDKCVDPCPEEYYKEYSPNVCSKCSPNCRKCSSSNDCLECLDGFVLNKDNQCRENCYIGEFVNSERKCKDCGLHCNICHDENECKVCNDGYHLHNGVCQSKCPDNYVSVRGLCTKCNQDSCLSCNSNELSMCNLCESSMYLKHGSCVHFCGKNYFANHQNKCENCISNCKTCVNEHSCTECNDSHFLLVINEIYSCVSHCPDGFVANSQRECTKCSNSTCKNCDVNNTLTCTECQPNQYLYNGSCVNECDGNKYSFGILCYDCDKSCSSCLNENHCLTCPTGFVLENNRCLSDCSNGYSVVKNTIQDECQKCYDGEMCLKCKKDINNCEECSGEYGLFNGDCYATCPIQFYKSENVCLSCGSYCLECQDNKICNVCIPPFKLDLNYECVVDCPNNTVSNENNVCQKCQNPTCKKCDLYNLNICTECELNEYLYKGNCLKACPAGTINNDSLRICNECLPPCNECIQSVDKCTNCIEGYKLLEENYECTDKCPSGKQNVNGKCENCSVENCDTCQEDDLSYCLSCINLGNIKNDGFFLFKNRCLRKCPIGFFGLNGHCSDCISNCNECDNASFCNKCLSPFLLKDQNCVSDCGNGFINNSENTECIKCDDNCSKCEAFNLSFCTKCHVNQVLFKGKCVDNCPNGFYVDENKECKACAVDFCDRCDSVNCNSCSFGKSLFDNKCLTNCPLGYTSINQICTKCIVDDCDICNVNINTCEMCKSGFFYDPLENKCYQNCPPNKFNNTSNSTCGLCSSNCLNCSNEFNCIACNNNFYLRNDNHCYPSCACGTQNVNGICRDCEQNCAKCLSSDLATCIDCRKGFFLTNGKCVEDCGESFFENTINGTCESCSPHCLDCNTGDKCNKCAKTHHLYNGKCMDDCPDGFVSINNECVKCETSNLCKKCKHDNLETCENCGMYINFNGKCIYECPAGFYQLQNNTCGKCLENCSSCLTQNICNECYKGFYLMNETQECIQNCPNGYTAVHDKYCKQCNDANCSSCSSDLKCLICNKPFTLLNVNGINECVLQCPNGFYNNGLECIPCSDNNCNKCTKQDNCNECNIPYGLLNNKCYENCPIGTTLEKGNCLECSSNCLKCDNVDSCSLCNELTYLFDKRCVNKCPEGYVAKANNPRVCSKCQDNCSICCSETDKCLRCNNNFILHQNHKTCVQSCDPSYVNVNGVCKKCTLENCSSCLNLDNKCEKCLDGFSLSINKDECVSQCPSAQFSKDGFCEHCNNCPNCMNESGLCTDCYSGFFLTKKNKCKSECTDGQVKVDDECLNCKVDGCKYCPGDNIEKCNECNSGMKLYENKCHVICPAFTFELSDGKHCENCSQNCVECTDSNHCNSCEYPFKLQGTFCVESCYSGFININGVCTECHDINCDKCSTSNLKECKICKSHHFLNENNECVLDCGDHFYEKNLGELGGLCGKCLDNCITCDNSTTCNYCSDPFVLQNNTCKNCCDSGYISINRICHKCHQDECHRCDSDNLSVCNKCKEGLFLLNGICVSDCGPGKYKNLESRSCVNCNDSNCNSCVDSLTCERCIQPFKLFENTSCVNSCPTNYVSNEDHKCVRCDDPKCDTCKSYDTSQCNNCNHGYLKDGKCEFNCGSGYFGLNKICEHCDYMCDECLDNEKCSKCYFPFNLDSGKCVSDCKDGYTPIEGKCIECSVNKCLNCSSGVDTCNLCLSPLVLFENKCLENCPEGYFNKNGICENCEADCLECMDSYTCTKCNKNTALHLGDCVNNCPTFMFKDEEKNMCQFCNQRDSCEVCSQSDNSLCEKCSNNTFLLNGKCVNNCGSGYFADYVNSRCEKCEENCDICYDYNTCYKCTLPFNLYKEDCLPNCPIGYVDVNGICIRCPENCGSCNKDINKCFSCLNETLLHEKQCVHECPYNGYFADEINGEKVCSKCNSDCATCINKDLCTSCNQGLHLQFVNNKEGTCQNECSESFVSINNVCVQCEDYNCSKCNSTNTSKCHECRNNTYLFNDLCVLNCPENYYKCDKSKTCKKCRNNCQLCTNGHDCIKCKENYFFQEIYDYTLGSESAKASYESSSFIMSENCDVCDSSKVQINSDCKFCKSKNCQLCEPGNDNVCQICYNSMALINGQCYEKCPSGHYQIGQNCYKCSENCTDCKDSDVCLKCSPGSYLHDNKCVNECPLHTVADPVNLVCIKCTQSECEKCNLTNTLQCFDCLSNYRLDEDTQMCIYECKPGYYMEPILRQSLLKVKSSPIVEYICRKCKKNCSSCNQKQCFECSKGYFLYNGECIEECPNSTFKNYLTSTCDSCKVNFCDKCDELNCFKCQEGLLLQENICVPQCSDGYYIDGYNCSKCEHGCKNCHNSSECYICNEGLVLLNGDCLNNCPIGMTPVRDECTQCSINTSSDLYCNVCLTDDPNTCLECGKGFLFEKKCNVKCPPGSYQDNTLNNKCSICDQKCKTCSDNNTCTSCDNGLILHNGKCESSCPEKTVLKNDKCVNCEVEFCLTCSLTDSHVQKCNFCQSPFVLFNNKCISECPEGTFYDQISNSCHHCSPNCSKCTSLDVCQTCSRGTYLNIETMNCQIGCVQEGFYPDCPSKECKRCDESCQSCWGSGNEKCRVCTNDYARLSDINSPCVKDCPLGKSKYIDIESQTTYCKDCSIPNCLDCMDNVCKQCEIDYILSTNGLCIIKDLWQMTIFNKEENSSFNVTQNVPNLFSNNNTFAISVLFLGNGNKTKKKELFALQYDTHSYFSLRVNDCDGIELVNRDISLMTISDDRVCNHKNWTSAAMVINKTNNKVKVKISLFDKVKEVEIVSDFDKVFANDLTIYNGLVSENNVMFYKNDSNSYESIFTGISPLVFTGYVDIYNYDITQNTSKSRTAENLNYSLDEVLKDMNHYQFLYLEQNKVNNATINVKDYVELRELYTIYSNYGIVFYTYGLMNKSKLEIKLFFVNVLTTQEDNSLVLGVKDEVSKIDYSSLGNLDDKVLIHIFKFTAFKGLRYIIKDEMGTVLIDEKIENSNIPRVYPKDLSISLNSKNHNSFRNSVLFKGETTDDKINLISPSVQDITKDFHCITFDINFECVNCPKNYKIVNGICEEDHFSNGIKLLHQFEVYNNNYNEQKLQINDTSNFTLSLFINKLANSLWDESSTSHKLISFLNTSNDVITILSEKIEKNYVSFFSIGGTEYKYNYSNILPSFLNVVISVKNNKCRIIVKFAELEVEGDALCNNLESIIFGDILGHEMHWEFKEVNIYPNSFDKTVKELLKKTIKNSNPICNLTDYTTGDCLSCPSKFVKENNNSKCNHMIAGFSQNYLFNYYSRNSIPNKTQFIYEISNAMNQKQDINSENYAVSGWIRILQDGSLNKKEYTKRYELFSLRNNVHIEDYEINPSNKLISFGYQINNGSSNYFIHITNSGENVTHTIKDIQVKIDSWTFVIIAVDVVNKKVTYDIFNDGTVSTSEIKLSSFPERLQSAGQLISFGVFENENSTLSLPSAESKNLYLIPNLSSYEKVKNHVLNNMKPNQIDESLVLENCRATVIDSNNNYICISCEETYNMIKNDKGLIECAKAYNFIREENPQFNVLQSGLLDTSSNCVSIKESAIESENVYTSFYFRFNKLPSKDQSVTILNFLPEYLRLVNKDGRFYLNDSSMKYWSNEITALNLLNWNSLVVKYERSNKKLNITYYGPGDSSSSISQNFSVALDLSNVTLSICSNTSDLQIYGIHTFKNNYGVPLIGEPNDLDCSFSCDKCSKSFCSSSKFGVENGKIKPNFVSLSNSVSESSLLKLSSTFTNTSKLRSDRYTFKAILNVVGKTDLTNNRLININISDNSYIRISVSNDLQNFAISSKSVLDSKDEKSYLANLPKPLTNAKLQIYISVGFRTIEGLIYEDLSNYKVFNFSLENEFEPLNASSIFELKTNTDNNSSFVTYSNVMISVDNKLPINSLIEDANQNDNLFLLTTCAIKENGKCLKCKDNYTLTSNNECIYGERSFINQPNSEIRLVTNTNKLSKTYILDSEVTNITYSINLNAPVQYSKKVGIARLTSGNESIIEIYTIANSIIAKNNVNDKVLVLNDYFVETSTSNFINIAVFADFENGYFKLNAFEPISGKLSTSDSTGKLKKNFNIKEVKIEVGFEDDNQNTETEYRFKISTSMFSINSSDLEAIYVKDTTVNMNVCSSACLEKCDINGICPIDKKLDRINLIKRDDEELLHSAHDLEPMFVNDSFLYDYLVVLELSKADLIKRFSEEELMRNTASTLLTFTESLQKCKGYKTTSFLPDEIQNKHSFSIVYSDQKLLLNPYEGENGERYLLLPVDIKFQDVEKLRIEIKVSIQNNSFMFNVYLDNLLFKMAYTSKSRNLQPFSKDTCIFTSPALLSAEIYFNEIDNITTISSSLTNNDKDICMLNNCASCLVNNSGEKLCSKCNSGFIMNTLTGICSNSDDTSLIKFEE